VITRVGTGPVGFGYKHAWLAIRTEDMEAAADALGVIDAHPASWAVGIKAAYEAGLGPPPVFLTPVVDGWTLAVLGGGELLEDDGVGGGALDLPSLSHHFGEVQKFATHRIADYQEWQRWVNGSPVRCGSAYLSATVVAAATRHGELSGCSKQVHIRANWLSTTSARTRGRPSTRSSRSNGSLAGPCGSRSGISR